MKRLAIGFACFLVVAAAGGYALWRSIGHEGSSDLERWIGSLIIGLSEEHVSRSSFEISITGRRGRWWSTTCRFARKADRSC